MFDYTKDDGQICTLGGKREPLVPHPDGKAWSKCCRGHEIEGRTLDCAFIKTQDGGARLDKNRGDNLVFYGGEHGMRTPKNTPFLCCHRSTDDGYHRVCAGWDACFGNKAEQSRKQRG